MEDSSTLRRRVVTQAENKEAEVVEKKIVKYTGPELSPFQIPRGKFFIVKAKRVLSNALRGFSGVFVDGYTYSFQQPPPEGTYVLGLNFFGKRMIESSKTIGNLKRPAQPITMYEFESCPFCKKVREAATSLDLDIMYYPTPRGAPHHRAKVKELGGKEQFPYMVDPNTGISMYESDAIIEYLYKEYGNTTIPLALRLGFLTTLTCGLAALLTMGKGSSYRKAKYPDQPLVLWGYENSPYTKMVRELLVELELPFLEIYCARGSPKRQLLVDKTGAFQAPYIEDPNTGVKMFESVEIIKYLEDTYALSQ